MFFYLKVRMYIMNLKMKKKPFTSSLYEALILLFEEKDDRICLLSLHRWRVNVWLLKRADPTYYKKQNQHIVCGKPEGLQL